jgi:hypothetical protein
MKHRKAIIPFLVLLSINLVVAQKLKTIGKLPESIMETSGIETHRDGHLWTFNDSGGEPEIYLVSTSGTLMRTIYIEGAWNRDWEDITRDDKGNIYIGNIGNNSNSNKDLCIFKIPDPDTIDVDTVKAEIIRFSFEDQTMFPPEDEGKYFDCETLMWFNNNLYLITKNRTSPFDGLAFLYSLPDQPGLHTAKKTGAFNSGSKDRYGSWITGGDISSDGRQMVILSSDKIWLFSDFNGENLFTGQYRLIQLPFKTQKEGICFRENSLIYITDEGWKAGIGRNIYQIKLDIYD